MSRKFFFPSKACQLSQNPACLKHVCALRPRTFSLLDHLNSRRGAVEENISTLLFTRARYQRRPRRPGFHSSSEPESSASSSRSRGICTTQRGWEFSVPTFNTSNPIALERQLYVAYCHEPAANLGEFTTKAKLFRFHQANPQRTLADPTGTAP